MTSVLLRSQISRTKRTNKLKLLGYLRNSLAHVWMPVAFLFWFYSMSSLVILVNGHYNNESSKSLTRNASLGLFLDSLYPSRIVKADSILCVLVNVWIQKILLFLLIALDAVTYSMIFLFQLESIYKRINFTFIKLLSMFDRQFEFYLRIIFDNAFSRFFVMYLMNLSNLLFGFTTDLISEEGVIHFGYNMEPNYLESNMFLFYLFGGLTRYVITGIIMVALILKQYHNKTFSEVKSDDPLIQFEQYMNRDYRNRISEEYRTDTITRIIRPDFSIKVQPRKCFKVRFFESQKYICLNEIDDDSVIDVDYITRRVQYKYNKLELVQPPFRNPFARVGFTTLAASAILNIIFGFILWMVFVLYHKSEVIRIIMAFSFIASIVITLVAICVRMAPEKAQLVHPIGSRKGAAPQFSFAKEKLAIISSDKIYDNSTAIPSTERKSLLQNSDDSDIFSKNSGRSAKVHPLSSERTSLKWASKKSY
jgi:hypothetical protein